MYKLFSTMLSSTYCNKTVQDGQMKFFRRSYYDSEQCKYRFTATRVDSDSDAEWEVEDIGNATNHFHESAKIVHNFFVATHSHFFSH